MPELAEFASNTHSVRVKPIDFNADGSVSSKTYHGATIVVNDKIIGRISSWNPQVYSRPGTHVYELSYRTYGRPIDYVPGRSEGYTASISRTEVWNEELEITLGFGAVFADLADQDRPWTTHEYLFRGYDVYRLWKYSGCWFQDKNEDAYSTDGDSIVRLTATVAFVSRVLLV